MRQYAIFYKRAGGQFSRLNQADHAKLIDHEEIREAVELLRQRPYFEGLAIRLDDELFNVVTFTQEAMAPNSFLFQQAIAESHDAG